MHQESSPRRIQTLVLLRRRTTLHRQHTTHVFLYRRDLPDTGLVEEISSSQARTAGSPHACPDRHVTHGARKRTFSAKKNNRNSPTHKPENRREDMVGDCCDFAGHSGLREHADRGGCVCHGRHLLRGPRRLYSSLYSGDICLFPVLGMVPVRD